jgi:ribosomal protein S18 acetylase RimI-like enzyme
VSVRLEPACRIGTVQPVHFAEVTRALAAAFRDNPLNRAVIRSDDAKRRLRSNSHGMRALLPVAMRCGDVRVAFDAHSQGREERQGRQAVLGALISSPPGRFPLPPPAIAHRLRCLIGQGWRVARRWGDVFEALQERHILEPHWYLGTLGVDPLAQRRGVGSALLGAWLTGVDRGPLPAYLETDRESNLAFYERFGFRVREQTRILGIPLWCMQRPAAALDASGVRLAQHS